MDKNRNDVFFSLLRELYYIYFVVGVRGDVQSVAGHTLYHSDDSLAKTYLYV